MKRLVKPLAAASLVALSASCTSSELVVRDRPEVCPMCAGPVATTPTMPPGETLPARFPEVTSFVVTHATLTSTDPHLRGGLGVEIALPLVRSGRTRWLFSQALMGGAWGDQKHGAVISESATGVKFSVLPTFELFDLYGVVTEGVLGGTANLPIGWSMQWGNKLGVGAGLRLFRTFAIELTGQWLYAFGQPFIPVSGGAPRRSVPDGSLSFGVDLCAFGTACDRVPIAQKSDDATCVIYTLAKSVCDDAGRSASRQQLCEDAAEALSIKPDEPPVLARDAFGRFLTDLADRERNTPRAGPTSRLVERNACLEGWRRCGRRQECLLAQHGQNVATRRMYAPYAIEMLGALGCNARGEVVGSCAPYACEETPPSVCQ